MTLKAHEFSFICDLVRRDAAIVLEVGKEYLVQARLLPVARQAGMETVSALVTHVRQRPAPGLNAKIVDALTTNETSWFRDAEPFDVLAKQLVPELLKSRMATHRLNIWSAACSSGQEPYSIAMIMDEILPAGWDYDITATDISAEMLTRAEAGRFSQLEINRGLPVARLVRHFERDGANWRVSPALRRRVTFKQMNLATTLPPLQSFDVVFLRNVLIYFDVAMKRQVLQRVASKMRPDARLLLGSAETTIGIDDRFERVPAGRTSTYRIRAAKEAALIGAQPRG